jgi:hypothetical protein
MGLIADIASGAVNGAIIGGVVGAMLSVLFYFFALANQRKGKALGRGHSQRLEWTADYRHGLNFAREVLEAVGGQFVSEDPQAGLIIGRTKQSLTSFGSTIKIQFHGPVGAINVDVSAAPSASMNDMGQSKKFVTQYVAEWRRRSILPPSGYPRVPSA